MAKKKTHAAQETTEVELEVPDAPAGMVALVAPQDATNVSHGGEQYEVEGGFVIVPTEAADALCDHGFSKP